MHAKLLQSHLTLCNPTTLWTVAQPGSSVHGFLQQRILEWVVAMLSSGDLPHPGIESTSLTSPSLAERVIYTQCHLGSPGLSYEKLKHQSQSCPALCNPMDYSRPGFCVHGILQSRKVRWVAIPYSSVFSLPSDQTSVSTLQADSLLSEPPGKPQIKLQY